MLITLFNLLWKYTTKIKYTRCLNMIKNRILKSVRAHPFLLLYFYIRATWYWQHGEGTTSLKSYASWVQTNKIARSTTYSWRICHGKANEVKGATHKTRTRKTLVWSAITSPGTWFNHSLHRPQKWVDIIVVARRSCN